MGEGLTQWRAERFGAPLEVLSEYSRAIPEPAEDQVLIRIAACGVALPDALMTRGVYPAVRRPPIVPGQEVVGTIERVGAKVSGFSAGARVIGSTAFQRGFGGLATHCLASAANLYATPKGMPDTEAAGFLIAFHTAFVSLISRGRMAEGESVLILGGAGSSGSAAIQVAKAMGARVCATARSTAKTDFCKHMGADFVVDLDAADSEAQLAAFTEGRGFGLIFDTVGGEPYRKAARSVARFGRIVIVGYASGAWADPDPLDMVIRSYSLIGALMSTRTPDERAAAEATLAQLYTDGKIRPPIDSVLPFSAAPEALARVERSETCGKVIIDMKS